MITKAVALVVFLMIVVGVFSGMREQPLAAESARFVVDSRSELPDDNGLVLVLRDAGDVSRCWVIYVGPTGATYVTTTVCQATIDRAQATADIGKRLRGQK